MFSLRIIDLVEIMNIRVLYHSSQYLLPVVNPPNLFTFIFSTLNIEYIFIVLRICDFSSFVFFFLRVLPTLSFIFCCRATDVPSMFWKRISRIHLFPFRDFFFFCFFSSEYSETPHKSHIHIGRRKHFLYQIEIREISPRIHPFSLFVLTSTLYMYVIFGICAIS